MSNYTNCKYNGSLWNSSSHQGRVNKVEENQGEKDRCFRRQTLKLRIRILKAHCLFLMKSLSNSVLPSFQTKGSETESICCYFKKGGGKQSQLGAIEVILNSSYFLKAYTLGLHVMNF